ncbi:winged helix-turn-helix transcriptional regulator [Mucilaginibacter jinjuensis]|uniref:Helix-turn-helix domain-containing protein n=1 Tax=Mucilaginibacter jinjuensis TaxID=1176721 RepID=A0ABY7T2G5_9SPHI|nr:helix-turn-helix domain-containing protein [Mucilaginibacter jinjuensis]WCT09921.1 helix-turn-helix domain-containing protein [Mucilaginibacter jinjuensis]
MASIRKNKDFNPYNCPVTHTMNKIGGKWKVLIIYAISLKCNRFSKLQKALPLITKQMLVTQLRELEEDGILERTVYAEVPPRVEYKLSAQGLSLMPIISVMQEWGLKDLAVKQE